MKLRPLLSGYCVLFFKQKTAYEMRISDWSSDVCSSDLPTLARTLAVKEVSEVFSISSTPGMHWRSTSTSFSASHTACRGASIRYCPVICMVWGSLLKDDGEGDARIAVPPPRFKSALRRREGVSQVR